MNTHFTDKESETQNGWMTCPRAHSQKVQNQLYSRSLGLQCPCSFHNCGCGGGDSTSGVEWVGVGSLSLGPCLLRLQGPGPQGRPVPGACTDSWPSTVSAPLPGRGVEAPGCGWGGLRLQLGLAWGGRCELPPPMAVQPGQFTESRHATENGWR